MADNATAEAPSLSEQVGQKAKEQTEQVKAQAQQVVQQGQSAASHVWDLGRDHFKASLTGQKDKAATGLGDLAQVLKQAGSQLREQGQAGGGQVAENLGGRVSDFSETLRMKEIEDILADTETFARHSPVLFLSLAGIIGFILARFLKSSAQTASA